MFLVLCSATQKHWFDDKHITVSRSTSLPLIHHFPHIFILFLLLSSHWASQEFTRNRKKKTPEISSKEAQKKKWWIISNRIGINCTVLISRKGTSIFFCYCLTTFDLVDLNQCWKCIFISRENEEISCK